MHYPVLCQNDVPPEDFVDFWGRLYSGYDEAFYQANIGQPLTEDRILKWFEWKNGTPLSPLKAQSILRYSLPEERLPADAPDDAIQGFLNRGGGAIWRIFWLHLQHPKLFPIYDQHVHRAMAFMLNWETLEIPLHNPTKVRSYLEKYRPFFSQFADLPSRSVDRALWAFGKFLGSGYGDMLPHEVIPKEWLQGKLDPSSPEYRGLIDQFGPVVQKDDELWMYDEPAPAGVNAGELGVALVRQGRAIHRVMLGVH
jgi:hypothetical protein